MSNEAEATAALRVALKDLREYRDECARTGQYFKADTINGTVLRIKEALRGADADRQVSA